MSQERDHVVFATNLFSKLTHIETLRVMCRMTTFSLVTDENENLHVEPITTSAAFPASLPQKLEYLENLVVKEISFECNIGDVRREIANFGSALYNQLPLITDW